MKITRDTIMAGNTATARGQMQTASGWSGESSLLERLLGCGIDGLFDLIRQVAIDPFHAFHCSSGLLRYVVLAIALKQPNVKEFVDNVNKAMADDVHPRGATHPGTAVFGWQSKNKKTGTSGHPYLRSMTAEQFKTFVRNSPYYYMKPNISFDLLQL